jgi:hypothetical protein
MKQVINLGIAGLFAAALMVMLKLLLTQQPQLAPYHYPPFNLAGQEGLYKLGLYVAWGAAYGVAYGILLKPLVPGGIFGPFILGAVPTLMSALVLPMYHNLPAVRDFWTLTWLYAHWTFFALCLLFIAGGKGGGGKRRGGDDD